jgi:hypothetical protein
MQTTTNSRLEALLLRASQTSPVTVTGHEALSVSTRLVNRELQNFGFLAITRRILVWIRQTFVEALDISWLSILYYISNISPLLLRELFRYPVSWPRGQGWVMNFALLLLITYVIWQLWRNFILHSFRSGLELYFWFQDNLIWTSICRVIEVPI